MAALTNPLGVEVGLAYAIIGPDGTRAVFNDTTDPDFVGFLSGEDGVTGLERAGVRESAETLPEADGGVHGAFRYDRLTFTFKGIIPPDAPAGGSWVQRQAKLLRATDAMLSDGAVLWTPSEAPPVQVSFRQQQPTRITGRRPKAFIVAGACERNVVQSQALRSVSIAPGASASGGFSSPLTSPLSSPGSANAQLALSTVGSSKAWPIITFLGPMVNPSILSATLGGRALNFRYALGDGETLVVDTDPRNRSVRLNGSANRYGALVWETSTWFPLVAGANDLRVGAASYSPGASFTVAWRDAWG
jgi:hypothetical protein